MKEQKSPYYSLRNIARILKLEEEYLLKVAGRAGSYYSPYDIQQIKSNGRIKWRHIDNPDEELKTLQKKILKEILVKEILLLPDGMVGGVAGKSIRDNAQPHVNQEILVTIDIKDCFPSINYHKIFQVWRNVIGCGTKSARLLTQLTSFRTILPQGAPTSSAICNLSLLPLFNEIKNYSEENSIAFTLYVDDITLSGTVTSVLPAMDVIIKIIQKNGFGVQREKIGIMPSNVAQRATGINTNKKINIAQKKIQAVRKKIIVIANRRNGITKQESDSVNGDILFIKSVSKEKAAKLKDFVDMLLPENEIEGITKNKIITRLCRHHNRDK